MRNQKINIEEVFSFNNDDKIVVGCSAGPDSMALLHMLLSIREKYNLQIICAHVNHNLRKQSVKEAKFMKEYCEKYNIPFEYMVIEEYGDDNFHNEARNIRYHFFEDLVNKYDANYLMTAHHGDDLIETILMRLTRGSNLQGYSGFHKIVEKDNYKIVRPLIHYTKDELINYDKKYLVPYFIDSSNKKDKYTRNRYRKVVLPFLKKEDPGIHLKFLKFSEELMNANSYIERKTNTALKEVTNNNQLDIKKFLELDDFIQREVLYELLHQFYQDDLILVSDKHISLLEEVIHNKKSNMQINLPNEVIAVKSYNTFTLKKNTEEITSYEIEFNTYAELPNNHYIEKIEDVSENSNNICRLLSSEISLPLIIRTRKIGDKIEVKGLNGSKKVKDIFIDKKIRLEERDSWPIVMDSKGKIVWIPGIKKSKFDKKKTENYDIIIKYC